MEGKADVIRSQFEEVSRETAAWASRERANTLKLIN